MNKSSRNPRAGATLRARSNPAPPTSAEEDPSAASPPEVAPSQLAGDPASIDRWLEAGRSSLLDLLMAAREGARRPRKRVLSRAEIRRQARDAHAQLVGLLDAAAEALRRGG